MVLPMVSGSEVFTLSSILAVPIARGVRAVLTHVRWFGQVVKVLRPFLYSRV
jgi:hypothetical protein